ncbi:hypothetical protein IAI18_11425 [Acetobacteraceae bacterium H6797]|nr:hypothetical protein [Acetobacteraceae bacterium H6797]
MAWSLDARTPVLLDASPAKGAVWLAEDGAPTPPEAAWVERFATPVPTAHPIGCACCQPRSGAAVALDRLFLARAKGSAPWFTEVRTLAATEAGALALRQAVSEDPVVSARFRLG